VPSVPASLHRNEDAPYSPNGYEGERSDNYKNEAWRKDTWMSGQQIVQQYKTRIEFIYLF